MHLPPLPRARAALACRAAALAAAALLAGCAADQAFREGRDLVRQGRPREALPHLEQAARLEPRSVPYRATLLQARERIAQEERLAAERTRAQARQREADAWLARADAAAAPAGPPAALAEAYRKPITLEFREAPLRSVFDLIARTSGLNFLFDRDVRTDQKASLFLRNSTIEQAVSLLLLTHQLEQRVLDANTVLVYPNTPAKQKDYQPLVVRSFYLAHAEAKTVGNTLKSLLKSRDVVVDDKLNLLIVRDSAPAIRLAEKLVALHDVPEPEVMLEVEILEVKRSRLVDLGVRWPDQLGLAPLAGTPGAPLTLDDLRHLQGGRIGATVGATTIVARGTEADANLLANPRIRARNREKAKVLIGERVPNITTTSTATGFISESVTYVDVGLKLDVEPTVYPDGEVAIKVALEVSSIIGQLLTKSGSLAYQIGTRTAQTVLRLRDGENQVLAGLINDEDRRSASKVPGLGDIPLLGRLFGSQSDDRSKTEIVLSITPRVVRNVRQPGPGLLEFDTGTETSLAATPLAAAAAPRLPAPAAAQAAAATATATPTPAGSRDEPADPAGRAPAAAGATLAWEGPPNARAGDLVTLKLLARAEAPVASLPVTLGFDPRVLQVVAVTAGDFLRQGGTASGFTSRVDPAGQVHLGGASTVPPGPDAPAPGVLASVQWRVLSAAGGTTRVQVLNAAPLGAQAAPLLPGLPPPHMLRLDAPAP
ncbi:secretin N-terminal domain-containing protein [Ramlibacter sp. MAHUQ-53]|uniref:secretin N-terminal domain-containing protein n=1 Tax=unclassified Ramlibacter TaxID=2617605 RepID=UPI003637EB22